MRGHILPLVIAAVFLTGLSPSSATELPPHGLPEWMLGQWVVTKVYEDPYVPRPDPEAEPIVWLSDQVMTVEPDRIELGKIVCSSFTAVTQSARLNTLAKDFTGSSLQELEIEYEDKTVTFINVDCKKIARIDNVDPSIQHELWPIEWRLVIDKPPQELEMFFYGGSFLKLRRLAPTS